MKYSDDQIEAARKHLRSLGPAPKPVRQASKQEAVSELMGDIKAALKKGYTYKQIAEELTKSGLEISEPTLKNYLTRAEKGKKKDTTDIKKKKSKSDGDSQKA